MNPRVRNLLLSIGALVAVFVAGFGVRFVVLQPVRELDKQISVVRQDLSKIATERRTCFENEDKVKALTQRTFSDDVDKASAKSGAMLTKLISQSGLEEADFTRLPVGPRKQRTGLECPRRWPADASDQLVVPSSGIAVPASSRERHHLPQ